VGYSHRQRDERNRSHRRDRARTQVRRLAADPLRERVDGLITLNGETYCRWRRVGDHGVYRNP
jgi:hypothetical protein